MTRGHLVYDHVVTAVVGNNSTNVFSGLLLGLLHIGENRTSSTYSQWQIADTKTFQGVNLELIQQPFVGSGEIKRLRL